MTLKNRSKNKRHQCNKTDVSKSKQVVYPFSNGVEFAIDQTCELFTFLDRYHSHASDTCNLCTFMTYISVCITEVIHSPCLTSFPIVADQHDLMKLLRVSCPPYQHVKSTDKELIRTRKICSL